MTRQVTRLTSLLLRQHTVVLLTLHVCLVFGTLLFSWLLRFDFKFRDAWVVLNVAPILILCRLLAMRHFHLLHGHWRYTNVDDAADIAKATVLGSAAFFVIVRYLLGVKEFPLSVYIIEGALSAVTVAGVRVSFRIMAEAAANITSVSARKRVLLIGAGFAAQLVLRELQQSGSGFLVVGCLDDDPTKAGMKIQGKLVFGPVDQLAEIARQNSVTEVLIAVPSATGAQMRRFVQTCEAAGLRFSTVPSLQDLLAGRARIIDLREVNLNDLLGRDPIRLDLDAVKEAIQGKVVLVTGAAGSIGSELCRQIRQYDPARLICLDQNETGLFYLEMELGSDGVRYYVGDYTNPERVRHLFKKHRIDMVFHAAAYKHVPLMEANPREALQNNVFGLIDFLDIAEQSKCNTFVLISSDKAVSPTNVMGATKRLGELILASRPASPMRCVSVRFGNVLGSQGSVIPVFQRQLAEQRRITVTHPDVARFFMTIREAVSLVLQAFTIGLHRDVLVLDMGEPIRILDLARTLIRLSGKSEHDVEIVFTGLRPGEKLYEELFYRDEQALSTPCEKIKRTSGMVMDWEQLESHLQDLRLRMSSFSDIELRMKIRCIIPEYSFEGMPEAAVERKRWVFTTFDRNSLSSASADD